MRKECRAKVNAEATPETMHAAFQRLFPMPCRSRYVALCLLPQQPLLARIVSPCGPLVLAGKWCSSCRELAFTCSYGACLPCSADAEMWHCGSFPQQPLLTRRTRHCSLSFARFVCKLHENNHDTSNTCLMPSAMVHNISMHATIAGTSCQVPSIRHRCHQCMAGVGRA